MTIARIAEAANVSYATAWRIINNQPCKSEEAIEKVRRAMTQLGYDGAARAMQRRYSCRTPGGWVGEPIGNGCSARSVSPRRYDLRYKS